MEHEELRERYLQEGKVLAQRLQEAEQQKKSTAALLVKRRELIDAARKHDIRLRIEKSRSSRNLETKGRVGEWYVKVH